MPKILYADASPYSAKVRMAATLCGIEYESIVTDTGSQPEWLVEINPLGKIPVFITDAGEAVYDSRAITQYLNREYKGLLFPRNAAKRTVAERMEALCDGICDALLAHVYERRMRPEAIVHQPWLDRQWQKAERGLAILSEDTPGLPARLNAGHLALRALLGYLALRFAGQWEKKNRKLVNWAKRFDAKFPDLAALVPQAPK